MRKIISLLVIFVLMLFPFKTLAFEVPEQIRVGLFYGSKAKSEYSVTINEGAKITGGGGTFIAEDIAVTSLTAKTDSFFHAVLDTQFETQDEAWECVSLLKENGILAFYMLDGSHFRVYAGLFETEEDAQNTKDTIISLGFDCEIYAPNPLSVVVFSGTNPWVGSVSSGLRIYPLSESFKLGEKEYRGCIEFYRDEKSDMAAVNVLDIDEYLMGVVPKEVSPSWNVEALKAQAIVARTYAVTNLNKFQSYGFNVDDTTQSQVYGGKSAEYDSTNQAVLETSGQYVLYDGKPAEVFFYSSSGGMTENVENVWGGASKPYLVSVPDIYENPDEASHYRWTAEFSPEDIKMKLSASGIDIGDILDMTIDEASLSGRSLKTTIYGTTGTHTSKFSNIRSLLGLYSNCFTISREGGETPTIFILSKDGKTTKSPDGLSVISKNGKAVLGASVSVLGKDGLKTYAKTNGTGNFVLSGKGYGHGIGMSQWGAKGMADAGFSYKEIITHYFKGTEVS